MAAKLQSIVDILRNARQAKGLTQRALADRVGLPQSHVSKIESGSVDLQLSSLIELARALDLELALLPRRAIPTVEALNQQSLQRPLEQTQKALNRELTQVAKLARSLAPRYPRVNVLVALSTTLESLTRMRLTLSAADAIFDNLDPIENALRILRKLPAEPRTLHKEIFTDLQRRTDRLIAIRIADAVNASQERVPAYRLDDDGEGSGRG